MSKRSGSSNYSPKTGFGWNSDEWEKPSPPPNIKDSKRQQMIEVCKMFALRSEKFAPNHLLEKPDQHHPHAQQVGKLMGIAGGQASKLLYEALQTGVYVPVDEQVDMRPPKDGVTNAKTREVGEKLIRKFPALREAIVVELSEKGAGRKDSLSDYIHAVLAVAMSETLWGRLRNGEELAIGPGRGPFYTALFFGYRYDKPYEGKPPELEESTLLNRLVFTSLSGRVSPSSWSEDGSQMVMMDADFNAYTFSRCVRGALVKPVGLNLCVKNENGMAKKSLGELAPYLDRNLWVNGEGPKSAVIGLGALTEGHRFLQKPRELQTIDEKLQELKEKQYHEHVGDLAHSLFIIEDEKFGSSGIDRSELENMLHEINEKLLCVSHNDHFSFLDRCYVIAGGKEKVRVLNWVLSQNDESFFKKRSVVLCVDLDCANAMLDR